MIFYNFHFEFFYYFFIIEAYNIMYGMEWWKGDECYECFQIFLLVEKVVLRRSRMI